MLHQNQNIISTIKKQEIITTILKLANIVTEIKLEQAKIIREYEINPMAKMVVPMSNFFHWFATNACNYLRLVALIDIMIKKKWKSSDLSTNDKEVNKYCGEYVKK